MNEQLIHQIALTKLPSVGPLTAKKLIKACGNPEMVFKENKSTLEKVDGIGPINSNRIFSHKKEAMSLAEQEVDFVLANQINALYFLDEKYPFRLKQCEDGPLVLFTKGNTNFNVTKVISIVGTRRATRHGLETCAKLVKEISPHQPLVISGLAYGVDGIAHQEALKEGLQTTGVLAHGLDRIYPSTHRKLAVEMCQFGGLATEFCSCTLPERENFPKRNRIVAGLSDVTIVVESSVKGGSLITARLAQDYNREVAAFPGSAGKVQSAGCNQLIKTNRAALVESAKDIEQLMGWKAIQRNAPALPRLSDLSKEQQLIAKVLINDGKTPIDMIVSKVSLPPNRIATLLLELEFEGVVQSFPGKLYGMV